MHAKLTNEVSAGPRAWAFVFRGGDEVMADLFAFAEREGIRGGHFSGIGAFSSAKLAYFDRGSLSYTDIPIDDQSSACR